MMKMYLVERQKELTRRLEAILFAAHEPLSLASLQRLLPEYERSTLSAHLLTLQAEYAHRALNLLEVADGWRFQINADYSEEVRKVQKVQPEKLSHPLLETLAIIVFYQPVTRGDIETMRGVSLNSQALKTLFERDWITVQGCRDVPGRPELLVTTTHLLDDLGMRTLEELKQQCEVLLSSAESAVD